MSKEDRPPAVLVGVQFPGVTDEALSSSLDELQRLAETLGLCVIGRITQKRRGPGATNVLGEGKLQELAQYTGGRGYVASFKRPGSRAAHEQDALDEQAVQNQVAAREADVAASEEESDEDDLPTQAVTVLVDQDLTPTQMRNLEAATGVEVLDRSMVILSIFQRHARTREAKIQVQIAHLIYMAPRLREAGADTERQRGGVGGKGAGETSLELGRRATRDRIAELRRSLVVVQREANTQRSRRTTNATNTVALVGYTNAGKSRLMRGLTNDVIYIADQLFATLDTTVRVLMPETRPRILISDTVGFIKNLPHDLVASFRSTLEEAKDANLHLHVLDAADAAFRDQYDVTREVLSDIGAADHARLLILNKCDLLSKDERAALAVEFPDAVLMSAQSPDDIAMLHGRIQAHYERFMEDVDFLIPYDRQANVALLHDRCRVLEERYEEDGTHMRVRAPESVLGGLRRELAAKN
ncbi:MAG: GTP-binding protein HflX [Myxococcota bacterium]|jgi:GTP-binding protein HflX